MDVLIRGGTVLTCDIAHNSFEGDVLMRGNRIVALGPHAAQQAKAPYRVLDASNAAILPGFVQTHLHLVQVLFRGMADDLPLLAWLQQRIWPLEAAHTEASLRASAELGLLELLRGGTTTFLDMGTTHGHDIVLDAIDRFGLRAHSGKAMMDRGENVPARLRESTRESLHNAERHIQHWAHHPRVRAVVAPRFILSCSETLIRDACEMAKQLNAIIHTHAAEHTEERAAVREQLGGEDIAVLAQWGAYGSRTVLAHCVQITDDEMRFLAQTQTRVAHCPSANLKLGSGIARVHAMRQAGVVVGLGADGAPCNNNLDMLTEIRHAALIAKSCSGPSTLSAHEVLRMATLDGATALGMQHEIGSIEIGKKADLVVIDLGQVHSEPGGDAASRIVYTCRSSEIRHVVLDGIVRMQNHHMLDLDADRIVEQARVEGRNVLQRAGLA